MTAVTTGSATRIESLRDQLSGRLLTPGDPDYEAARIVFAGDIDRHPALIVRVAGSDDISSAIAFAREQGLELALRSGGHSAAGHSTTDGGLVIDLRDMKQLDIDVDARTVWAETGLAAVEVTKATSDRNLAIGFGDTGSVGIGGITTGGGIGFLVRKHGMTIDNLEAAEIVTADGSHLTIDENNEPDLFWAIRGGGGNFGVATRFKYRLQPMESFVGGLLVLPATVDSIAGFMEAAAQAPHELSTIANFMNCPPMPFLPEETAGTLVNLAFVAYAGDAGSAEEALAPFRALAEPLADMVKAGPYADMYGPEDESYRPKAIDHCFFIDHVDRATAQTIIDRLEASDSPLRAVQLRVLGGAMARVPQDATAFAHRDRKIMAIAVNFFEGAEDYPTRAKWTKDTVAALDQGVSGVYVNFLRDEGTDRIHEAYPSPTFERLARIKAQYDPDNVFRLNQNIPPAA